MNPTGEFGFQFEPIRIHAVLAPRAELEGAYAALKAILEVFHDRLRFKLDLLDKETER